MEQVTVNTEAVNHRITAIVEALMPTKPLFQEELAHCNHSEGIAYGFACDRRTTREISFNASTRSRNRGFLFPGFLPGRNYS